MDVIFAIFEGLVLGIVLSMMVVCIAKAITDHQWRWEDEIWPKRRKR